MKRNNKNYIGKYLMFIFSSVLIFSCGIEVEQKTLASYTTTRGKKINIYYIDVGATGKEVIQVTSSGVGNVENLVANFEKNYLQNSILINDSVLMLILTDSGNVKLDTVKLKLPLQ